MASNTATTERKGCNGNRNLTALRKTIGEAKPRKLIDGFTFKQPLKHGWLLPYLLDADTFTWNRWEHWFHMMQAGEIGADPVPQIDFSGAHRTSHALKMLERSLNTVANYGDWRGWSSWHHFDYFLDWLLFGLGDQSQKSEPETRSDQRGASERLYQTFNLETMLAYPYDYFGDILAENQHGRHRGFFPTPMDICALMTKMQMDGEDMRAKSVCDPAVGTGRMLLLASNYSYLLYGVDIDATVLKALKVNGWLYAPWLVRPLPFLHASPEFAPVELPAIQPAPVADKRGQFQLLEA